MCVGGGGGCPSLFGPNLTYVLFNNVKPSAKTVILKMSHKHPCPSPLLLKIRSSMCILSMGSGDFKGRGGGVLLQNLRPHKSFTFKKKRNLASSIKVTQHAA